MSLYEILVIIQALSVLVLMIGTNWIFCVWKNKGYSILFLFGFSTLINNLGYLMEMTSKTSEAMLLGTKFEYVGKAFIPLSLFLIASHFCNVRVSEHVRRFLCGVHSAVIVLVLTCDYHKLWYTSIEYVDSGLFPHNVYGHGLFYNMYTILLMLYFIYLIAIAILFFRKKHDRMQEQRVWSIFACSVVCILGFVFFLSGLSRGYDTTAISYMICVGIIFYAIWRQNLFEALEIVKEYVMDNLYSVLVAVDKHDNLLFHNERARELFPDIEWNYTELINEYRQKLKEDAVIKRNNSVYRISTAPLHNGRRNLGCLYILDNITREYDYAKSIKLIARTDELSGLKNRRAFAHDISKIENQTSSNQHICVVMDIDGLKQVNDKIGHHAGDELIRGASKCINDSLGELGDIYRTGGDEFVAILNGPKSKVLEALEDFQERVDGWQGMYVKNMSISVGTADSEENKELSIAGLVELADSRMYEVKESHHGKRS